MLRALREGAASGDASVPRRVRVELPLPPADRNTDDLVYLGLHGQAADWSGGMQQRYRVTKGYVEDAMLDGYDHEYLGLLDRDADGMGVWRVGENMTAVAHPSDVTVGFFLRLLRGEYGGAVLDPCHVVVVVNAFWSGNGERVGQPWEFGLKREAREVLGRDGDWDKVYCCRRARSAAGVEGTLVRSWPGPWRLYDARGIRVVLETERNRVTERWGRRSTRRRGRGRRRGSTETPRIARGTTIASRDRPPGRRRLFVAKAVGGEGRRRRRNRFWRGGGREKMTSRRVGRFVVSSWTSRRLELDVSSQPV